ncbi:MAG: helix-turn-helix domain-containing protein [Leucobacter sp.]
MSETIRLRVPGDIGIALQQARLRAGFTQAEFAQRLALPQATVSQMENGKSTIYLRRLLEMFDELNVELTAALPEEDADAARG